MDETVTISNAANGIDYTFTNIYSGNSTNANTSITNITTTNIKVGMTIIGTGIPNNTTVSSIASEGTNNNGTITISNAATANGTTVSFAFSHTRYLQIHTNKNQKIYLNSASLNEVNLYNEYA
jgi:multisubunit Na+/H+ antiporter MnhE subunit